jgi:hypothetical protein
MTDELERIVEDAKQPADTPRLTRAGLAYLQIGLQFARLKYNDEEVSSDLWRLSDEILDRSGGYDVRVAKTFAGKVQAGELSGQWVPMFVEDTEVGEDGD